MSKTLVNILTSPISLINQQVGDAISGAFITGIGVATGNPALIGFGLSRFSSALEEGGAKPAQTDVSLKIRSEGTFRRAFSIEPSGLPE